MIQGETSAQIAARFAAPLLRLADPSYLGSAVRTLLTSGPFLSHVPIQHSPATTGEALAQLARRAIDFINTLAPLSVVVAALGILNTIRLARIKRQQDDAQSLRETLNATGTAAYTLNWSLIGNMDVAVPVLQLRDAIEARLVKPITVLTLSNLLNDPPLIESLVGKAWRDSGMSDRFRQQALDFSRLSADIGQKIPLAQEALQRINARLRHLLEVDVTLIDALRKDPAFKNIPATASPDPLAYLHQLLLDRASGPDDKVFSKACTFLRELANASTDLNDKRSLKLYSPRIHPILLRDGIREWSAERHDRRIRDQMAKQFLEKFPNEGPLLVQALDIIVRNTGAIRRKEHRLRLSAAHILRVVRASSSDNPDLVNASQELVDAATADDSKRLQMEHAFLWLKAQGIPDPEVDLYLAVGSGVIKLLHSAFSRGASAATNANVIFTRHATVLVGFKDEFLNEP